MVKKEKGRKKTAANRTRASYLQIYSHPLAAEPRLLPASIDPFPSKVLVWACSIQSLLSYRAHENIMLTFSSNPLFIRNDLTVLQAGQKNGSNETNTTGGCFALVLVCSHSVPKHAAPNLRSILLHTHTHTHTHWLWNHCTIPIVLFSFHSTVQTTEMAVPALQQFHIKWYVTAVLWQTVYNIMYICTSTYAYKYEVTECHNCLPRFQLGHYHCTTIPNHH